MKYVLFSAVDSRDSQSILWLHDVDCGMVALFDGKTAPSRIKHRSLVSPEGITWSIDSDMVEFSKANTARKIAEWEFNL